MDGDNITVPPLRPKRHGDEIDGPPPTLKIQYEGVFNQYICYPYTEALITLTNDTWCRLVGYFFLLGFL